MKHLTAILLWTCVFLVLLVAIDQVLLHVPFRTPVLRELRAFHVDFRGRLLHLRPEKGATPAPPSSRPSPPESTPAPAPAEKPAPAPVPVKKAKANKANQEAASGYVYADESGSLQFADTLEEIPARFRADARPMTE